MSHEVTRVVTSLPHLGMETTQSGQVWGETELARGLHVGRCRDVAALYTNEVTSMTTVSKAPAKVSAIVTAIEGSMLRVTFATGEMLTLDADKLSPDIQTQAIMHGLKQKLVDAAAMSRNPDTGKSATIADKFAAVKEVYDRITGEAPTWNAVREGGGNSGGLLYRALVRFYADKRTADEVKVWLDARTDDEKSALRKNPKIAAIIAEIQAEKPDVAKVDTDALLAGL